MSGHATFQPDPDKPDTWLNEPERDDQRQQQKANGQSHDAAPDPELLAALAVQAWCTLPLTTLRRLLGDVVTEAARVFLVGATGIGKTLFAYAILLHSPRGGRSCIGRAAGLCGC